MTIAQAAMPYRLAHEGINLGAHTGAGLVPSSRPAALPRGGEDAR